MDDINEILERTGLSTIPTSGLTIISLLGVSDKSTQISPVILANRIVGSNVFSHRKESLKEGTIEVKCATRYVQSLTYIHTYIACRRRTSAIC